MAPTSSPSNLNSGISGCPEMMPSPKASSSDSIGYRFASVRNNGACGCRLSPVRAVAWQREHSLARRVSPRLSVAASWAHAAETAKTAESPSINSLMPVPARRRSSSPKTYPTHPRKRRGAKQTRGDFSALGHETRPFVATALATTPNRWQSRGISRRTQRLNIFVAARRGARCWIARLRGNGSGVQLCAACESLDAAPVKATADRSRISLRSLRNPPCSHSECLFLCRCGIQTCFRRRRLPAIQGDRANRSRLQSRAS
jgi:hypothetical protein